MLSNAFFSRYQLFQFAIHEVFRGQAFGLSARGKLFFKVWFESNCHGAILASEVKNCSLSSKRLVWPFLIAMLFFTTVTERLVFGIVFQKERARVLLSPRIFIVDITLNKDAHDAVLNPMKQI